MAYNFQQCPCFCLPSTDITCLVFWFFFFFSTGMDPRTLHVLGKQSNTKLDAQPLNLYFSMPQKPLNISRNWCGFASESVNINENCSLGSWEFKEDVHFDLWSHPDEARRKGCFSLFFFFFDASLFTLLYFPSDGQTPQWLLPKQACSYRNLRERKGGKKGRWGNSEARRAQGPAPEARFFESHSVSGMCQLAIWNKLFNPSAYCFPYVFPEEKKGQH